MQNIYSVNFFFINSPTELGSTKKTKKQNPTKTPKEKFPT
jgi:hypothetical protein